METINKLREALKLCVDEMCDRCRELAAARGNPLPCLSGCEPVRKAKLALVKPLRNCDVGTAEEQEKRFDAFCRGINGCRDCIIHIRGQNDYCHSAWSQMPYEGEGGK